MKIKLIAVGTKMPGWVNEGYREYEKRLPSEMKIELVEIIPGMRGKGADIQRAMEKEAKQIMAVLGKADHVIALDVKGKSWSTEQLAAEIKTWRMSGKNVALLVGGPEGLSRECLERAHQRWSVSKLTFPHSLVRIILAEQLYRACSILINHPYHR